MFRAPSLPLTIQMYKDCSVRKIDKEYKIHYSNLSRYTDKFSKYTKETKDRVAPVNCGYQAYQHVFSANSERQFAFYLRLRSPCGDRRKE
jgi:hypothetical protein